MDDVNGRPYAKLYELKAGDKVELDASFPCHKAGIVKLSKSDLDKLGFKCAAGFHEISGQADIGGNCIGVYNV